MRTRQLNEFTIYNSPYSQIFPSEAATDCKLLIFIKLVRVSCTHYFMSVHNLRCSLELIKKSEARSKVFVKTHCILSRCRRNFPLPGYRKRLGTISLIMYSILNIRIVNLLVLKKHQKLQCKCWHNQHPMAATKKIRSSARAASLPLQYGESVNKAN